jgi:hypothetical protein
VYVDDIIVKIKSRLSLLDNLAIVFDRLRSTCTMLNSDKCVFRVFAEKLLGFLVSPQGIEANPEKIKVIEVMQLLARIKDVQELTGCLAALSRFISRLTERPLPFFKLLRKSKPFVWTQEADETFQELKKYLTSLLIMVALEHGEPLLLYIVVTAEVVSMVLIVERPEPQQPQAPKGAPADDSRSQDLDTEGGPRDKESSGS